MTYYVKFKTEKGWKVDSFKSKEEVVKHIRRYINHYDIMKHNWDNYERSYIRLINNEDYHNFNVRIFNSLFNNTILTYRVYRSFEDLKKDLLIA